MARGKRRSGGSRSFRKRASVDWVQSPPGYDEEGGSLGVVPPTNIAQVALVHSKQMQLQAIGSVVAPEDFQSAAFPNHVRRQVIRAVRGQFLINATEGWASGNFRSLGFRIAKFKQDPQTGDVLVPPGYCIMTTIDPLQGPYVYADSRFLWERRVHYQYNPDNILGMKEVFVKWSGYESLEHDECLAIIFENQQSLYGANGGPAGGEVIIQFWLRTLCQVPS